MFTSFSTALSALSATSTAIDVVGNNLANLNTTGYKTSVVSFHDLVTQSLGAGLGETQVGFGTARPITSRQFIQGAVQASSGMLDAAVQGDGFFVVKDSSNNQLYSRAGNFKLDMDGNLLTNTRQRVQGWTAQGGAINTNGPIGDIKVPVGQMSPPVQTTNFSVDVNLNASAEVGDEFSTPMSVIDSLGNTHVLTVTYTKTAPLTWSAQVSLPGDAVLGGTAGTPYDILTTPVTLIFDSNGKLQTPDAAGGAISLDIPPLADSATGWSSTSTPPSLPLIFNLYNGADPRVTEYSQPSTKSANAQDGQPAAQLTKVGLGDGGQIMAQYSNGTQKVVGQLALASIRNPESLIAVGENNYQGSAQTALPAVGVPSTGGRGQILGGSLEASTVDIASEFTNLIVLQRAYEANSKIVTAVDQLSQTTINLIR